VQEGQRATSASSRSPAGAPWGWIGAVTAAGFLLRAAVLARSLPVLDRLFVPDDTYYTLSIARSLARGHGPAADGHTLTSGFQPLQAFLLVPVHWVVGGTDAFVRADMVLLVLADTVTIAVLGWLAWRLAGKVAAITAAVIWASSPIAVSMALGGLETSLAVCFAALLVAAWIRADDGGTATGRWVLAGVVAGLAVLARFDAMLLVALLGAMQLWRGPRRVLVPAGIAAAVVLAPWWIYCTVQFGSPVPTSGRAEHALAPLAPFSSRGFAQIAGAVAGGPFTSWRSLRVALDERPGLGVALFVLAAALLLFVAWWWYRSARGPTAVVAVLPVYAVGLMVFYAWFGVGWFFSRYMTPVAMVATLVLATVVGRAWVAEGRRRTVVLGVTGALVAAAFVSVVVGTAHNLTADVPYAAQLDSYTGYRDMALVVDHEVPRGERVAAWQSGAVGYFAGDDHRVVNLDGVVNPAAADATRDGTIPEYLRDEKVQWIADTDLRVIGFALQDAKQLDPVPRLTFVKDAPQFPRFPKYAIAQINW
jgi:hypothetical protein